MPDQISHWAGARRLVATRENRLRNASWLTLGFLGLVFVAGQLGLYVQYPRLDIPTHFLGGLLLARVFSAQLLHRLTAFVLTALAALGWELGEYLWDAGFGTSLNHGLGDTLSDIFFGLLGAAIALSWRIVWPD